MIEIFEMIMQYPLEFLAGLGISSGTIYTGYRIIKGFISLITKKSIKAKEKLNQENIANFVIDKLGGVQNFVDSIANTVIDKLTNCSTIKEFKTILEKIANSSNCPIELKAYIDTVLSQKGSEQLALLYEQTKSTLLSDAKIETQKIIDNGSAIIEDEKTNTNSEISEIVVNDAQVTTTQVKKASNKKKKDLIDDSDISYV